MKRSAARDAQHNATNANPNSGARSNYRAKLEDAERVGITEHVVRTGNNASSLLKHDE